MSEVSGLAQALKVLKQVDPALRKAAIKSMKEAAQPLANDMRALVPEVATSGWSKKGRLGFSPGRVRNSIRPQFRASERQRGRQGRYTLLRIRMASPGGSVYERAGSASGGRTRSGRAFVAKLNAQHGGPSRVMWRAADANLPTIIDAVELAQRNVQAHANRVLKERR